MGRLYKLMSIQLVLKTKVTNCLVTENCDVFLSKFGNVCLIGFVCDCGDQMWNKLEPLNDGTFSSYEKQQQKYLGLHKEVKRGGGGRPVCQLEYFLQYLHRA